MDNKDHEGQNNDGIARTSLFTWEEIETIVKDFVLAYIRGNVVINTMISPQDYKKQKELQTGHPIDEDEAFNQATKIMQVAQDRIMDISGLKSIDRSQYVMLINHLFEFIIRGRGNLAVQGTIPEKK